MTCSSCEAAGQPLCPALALLISTLRQRSHRFNSVAANLFTSLIARTQQGIYLPVLLASLLSLPARDIGDSVALISPLSSSFILSSSLSNLIVIWYSCLTPKFLSLDPLSAEESCRFVLLYAISSCYLLLVSGRQPFMLLTKYYYSSRSCKQLSALNYGFWNGLQPLNGVANSSLLTLYALLYIIPPILCKLLVSYSSILALPESLVSAQQQQRVLTKWTLWLGQVNPSTQLSKQYDLRRSVIPLLTSPVGTGVSSALRLSQQSLLGIQSALKLKHRLRQLRKSF